MICNIDYHDTYCITILNTKNHNVVNESHKSFNFMFVLRFILWLACLVYKLQSSINDEEHNSKLLDINVHIKQNIQELVRHR